MILGKNGQLGAELVSASEKSRVSYVAYSKEELNVTNYNKIHITILKIKPRVIINTAAFHVVPDCEINPLNAFEVNCVSVSNLANICKKYRIRFVTYSTDYVFDGKKHKPYIEVDLPNPLQMYGLSKLSGEYAAFNNYPAGTFIIRTCGVYGGKKGSRSKKGNFVLNILKKGKEKGDLEVNNMQIVNPTYAKDLAKATLSLLDLKPDPGIYHIVSEGYTSWYNFAKKIFEYANINKKVIPVNKDTETEKIRRPVFSALLNTKAKKLGIRLPFWADALKNYIAETTK